MVIVENAVDIRRSLEEVFDYCTDIVREPEWNPRTRRVEQLTQGPIGLGTRFEGEWIKGNPMIIEYVHFERPTQWASVGHSTRLDAKSEGRVSATRNGAHLIVRMELQPRGLLILLLPLMRRTMHRREDRNLTTIKAILAG
jgi:Polyketide cyclase / dehydrase and lipid transport